MIIVTQKEVADSNKESVVIIFESDQQRKLFAKQLTEMPDNDSVRIHATYNSAKEVDIKKLIDESLIRAGYEAGIKIIPRR
jgi:acetolactate synthase regulatory subunit